MLCFVKKATFLSRFHRFDRSTNVNISTKRRKYFFVALFEKNISGLLSQKMRCFEIINQFRRVDFRGKAFAFLRSAESEQLLLNEKTNYFSHVYVSPTPPPPALTRNSITIISFTAPAECRSCKVVRKQASLQKVTSISAAANLISRNNQVQVPVQKMMEDTVSVMNRRRFCVAEAFPTIAHLVTQD